MVRSNAIPIHYQSGQHIDHYTIVRQLSSGTSSRVYLAKDARTEQQVVLKFPRDDLVGGADSYKSYLREKKIGILIALIFLLMISFGFLAQFAHSVAH